MLHNSPYEIQGGHGKGGGEVSLQSEKLRGTVQPTEYSGKANAPVSIKSGHGAGATRMVSFNIGRGCLAESQ